MLAEDRGEFDAQIERLCAAYNVPCTDLRKGAYWQALQRMNIVAFARVVDHAIGENGDEKIPSTKRCWSIWQGLKQQAPAPRRAPEEPQVKVDDFTAFANRRLWKFLYAHGGTSNASLAQMIVAKDRLVADFKIIDSEDRVTAAEFAEALRLEWVKIFEERPLAEIEEDREQYCRTRGLRYESPHQEQRA